MFNQADFTPEDIDSRKRLLNPKVCATIFLFSPPFIAFMVALSKIVY